MENNVLASNMSVIGNIVGAFVIILNYYIRKHYVTDMWGYTVFNTFVLSTVIAIACFYIKPDMKFNFPKEMYTIYPIYLILFVVAALTKITAITYTSNIGYTSIYKSISNVIVILISAFYLKENYSPKGCIGVFFGLISAYLIYSEQQH
jgi:drug/metabolite transporter (DMT)-like permease